MRDLRKEDELNRMMNGVGPQQQQNEQRQAQGFDAVSGHVDGQQSDKNTQFDFYESRLDVEGFVADYFAYRANKSGIEWYEQPELPFGVQPEHYMMRYLAELFEKRHMKDLEEFIDELMADPILTFNRFTEIVNIFGRNNNYQPSSMNYGRLVGLISFGGLAATRMLEENMQRQVGQIFIYVSRFIRGRINQTWENDGYCWADFMDLGRRIEKREAAIDAEESATRRASRRWSMIGIGAAVVVVGAAFIGGKILASKNCAESSAGMVKVKVRYLLVELLTNDEKPLQMDKAFIAKFYTALMKAITEVHGDYGNGAVRNSILIKVADTDICLIRIESTAEM
ncbi:hypothetical protein WR25_05429 [Diploscapter pachys]|uniref:Apoptosis regulator Bcl-2 family BH4 domain-containing protein n=1 Tax=Diploscapter pachys TaxID=2018661 RepID=A0A2A2LL29_9BILA|nr:hypothetical protein WR25_05429 [Diploscapter pachys]